MSTSQRDKLMLMVVLSSDSPMKNILSTWIGSVVRRSRLLLVPLNGDSGNKNTIRKGSTPIKEDGQLYL
jgi:hypothetical protein